MKRKYGTGVAVVTSAAGGLLGCALMFGLSLSVGACGPSGDTNICEPGAWLACTCVGSGADGWRICDAEGRVWSSCDCSGDAGTPPDGATVVDAASAADAGEGDAGESDGAVVTWCTGRADGTWCDADDLVTCLGGVESQREACTYGCDASGSGGGHLCAEPDPTFCVGLMNGPWCDGDDLVNCQNDVVVSRETCVNGCVSMPLGTADECATVPFCTTVPNPVSPTAPTSACNYMDWNLSPDGFYLNSRFGTDNDPTTWGGTTSCGWLQGHYTGYGCRYDVHSSSCLDNDTSIPWAQGHVDYLFADVMSAVGQYAPGDVPFPEYFYVAGAQRFNCGALLRVSNPANSRCVVVYTEDGGPGATYEGPSYGGRRILDASPALQEFLGITSWGWANSAMVYVEWGLPGDVPGQACTPCQSAPVQAGSESSRTPYDVNHMQSGVDCRP